ncbi:MAG: polymerase subunit delta, polymerase subunit delta protein [Parcubacteria group bacterium]|nr:polymerase subunit delta, polymerase subunit delta protein [Parcubacteria group bacterium]
MAHHAYYVAGEAEAGISSALSFAERELGFVQEHNPDVVVLRFGLFSVDDARKLIDSAYRSASGDNGKVIIASMTRVFHEAQNALLKLFEEPPEGVTLILCVPSAGLLLPTLRSRLLSLPISHNTESSSLVQEFLSASTTEREKIVTKLLDRAKSDKDEIKQGARSEAISLVEGLLRVSYELGKEGKGKITTQIADELRDFEDDLSTFLPILHERSAPLKLIFEHILLVIPTSLAKAEV